VAPAGRTSCRSVVYIGDSTSAGEVSTNYIPNPKLRLQAQLADAGVGTTFPEISGARSIVETFQGEPNAAEVAQAHIAGGFHGCWIVAMGTNDMDNIRVGSTVGPSARIARMMSIIGQQPTLWIAAVTLLPPTGPYSEAAMEQWNQSLVAACRQYPNMRIFDWPAHAQQSWFIPDGIHYYSPGYVARAYFIAKALARAFPDGTGFSPSCVVQ
jgi:hypothetical protein